MQLTYYEHLKKLVRWENVVFAESYTKKQSPDKHESFGEESHECEWAEKAKREIMVYARRCARHLSGGSVDTDEVSNEII